MLLGSLSDITQQCAPTTCPVHDKLIRVQHESRRVNQDLIHLLTLYRIDKSQYLLNITENMLIHFLEEIIDENEAVLSGYGINMQLECPDNVTAFFDLELVSGVINTIINNSYRYTQDIIKISCTNENNYTVISIEDNGPCYPDHMLSENISSTEGIDHATGSTGLGLYFASRVAGLHKNKTAYGYTVTSNTGISGGGKFSIFLP